MKTASSSSSPLIPGSPLAVMYLVFQLERPFPFRRSLLSAANVGRREKNEGKPKATFLPTKLMFFTLLLIPRGLELTLAFFFSDFSGELPSRWADVTIQLQSHTLLKQLAGAGDNGRPPPPTQHHG